MMDMETGEDFPQSKKKKEVKKGELKYSFSTIEHYPAQKHCHYSGLPSPAAYEKEDEEIDK